MTLEETITQYKQDIDITPRRETIQETVDRGERIRDNFNAILDWLLTTYNISTGLSRHMDGGAPDSVYLPIQMFDGGDMDESIILP